jgi:hypothetical protein
MLIYAGERQQANLCFIHIENGVIKQQLAEVKKEYSSTCKTIWA